MLANARGLCPRHMENIRHRPDLRLEAFFLDRQGLIYRRQKSPRAGCCVVREAWPDGRRMNCGEKIHARGLCRRHYKTLGDSPQILKGVADAPRPKSFSFCLKANPKAGTCVIQENGVGCSEPAATRRLVCKRHWNVLYVRGLLNELTDRFLPGPVTIARKPPDQTIEGYCVLQVNGVSCLNVPHTRGICQRCLGHIQRLGLDYEALALPPVTKTKRILERKARMLKGVCIAVVDSVPCHRIATARGLCDAHYAMARTNKVADRMILSREEAERLPEVPHFYLDKNVLINYAFSERFGGKGEESSVALVKAVLNGKVRGTVSLDCVRAVYSHVGHRLARPQEEGGKGMDPAQAEAAARKCVGKLFFGQPDLWLFVNYSEEQARACLVGGMLPGLSLEDALEVSLFGTARQELDLDLFVTADAHVLKSGHGAHPAHVVKTYLGGSGAPGGAGRSASGNP